MIVDISEGYPLREGVRIFPISGIIVEEDNDLWVVYSFHGQILREGSWIVYMRQG